MAITYVCSMDHYGSSGGASYGGGNDEESGWTLDNDIFLGDGWSSLPTYVNENFRWNPGGLLKIEEPPWGARGGEYALVADKLEIWSPSYTSTGTPQTLPSSACTRLTIPGDSSNTRYIHFAFGTDKLPNAIGHGYIAHFQDSDGKTRGSLRVDASGRLQVTDGSPLVGLINDDGPYQETPTVLAVSSTPVIAASTWHYLSIKLETNDGDDTCDVDIYDGDIVPNNHVMSAKGLAFSESTLPDQHSIDVIGFLPVSMTGRSSTGRDDNIRAVRDIVITDESGSYNTGLLGQVFVSAQAMRNEDDEGENWTAHSREKIGSGVLDHATNRTGLRFADAASFDVGASDFTFETLARFEELPQATETMTLVSKWRSVVGERSYRLYYDGGSNELVWEVSADGSTETVAKAVPWTPVTGHWYAVAVVRSSNQLLFFIDGEQIGTPVSDSNSYFDSPAYLGVGVQFDENGDPDTNGRFGGWLDETRFTVGVARYTSDYNPAASSFPRSSSGDSDFSSVVLLLGYDDDGPIVEESGYSRAVVLGSPPVTAILPNDSAQSYRVLNQRPAWDDTFIEASILPATGIFTFEALPTSGETITLDAKTYTYVDAFSTVATNEIMIGADIEETIDNTLAAVNGGAGEGTAYGTGTTANTTIAALEFLPPQFKVQATTPGAAGNSLATTETCADGFFEDDTLTGGQDVPGPSDFAIERIPLDATGVLGVQMTARAYKTDAGSATFSFGLVGPQGGVASGAGSGVDLSPAWYRQVLEEDPDTNASITPSTLIAGRARFDRSG